MLDTRRFAGLNRSVMLLLVLIVLGGCNTGNRFGNFLDQEFEPPPPPPEPVCDQPLLNDVAPAQGGAGTILTFSGINFSDSGNNRVVMSSFSGQAEIDALILSCLLYTSDAADE